MNSLKALSSLQATVTNFATNFISSGLAGYFLFEEPLPSKVFFLTTLPFCLSKLLNLYCFIYSGSCLVFSYAIIFDAGSIQCLFFSLSKYMKLQSFTMYLSNS
jgi:hypothetical protein